MNPASAGHRAVRIAATVLLVVVGVGAAGVAGIAASLVCWKEPSSYCGAAQLGWRPVELAPLTHTSRPIPARLEGAPRCAAPAVVRGDADELGPDETVYVALLRARHTQQWRSRSRVARGTHDARSALGCVGGLLAATGTR